MTKQGVVDNSKHIAGLLIGRLVLRWIGVRYSKEHRGKHWFSTVAANMAADKEPIILFPYR